MDSVKTEKKKKLAPLVAEINTSAEKIRNMKKLRKKSEHGNVPGLDKESSDNRHMHVAYCELRGRKRNDIEQRVRACTPALNEEKITEIKKKYLNVE